MKFCAIRTPHSALRTRAWIGAARRAREASALDADREQQILDWIQQKAEQSTPLGKTEIKDCCTPQLKVPITRGWVNSFIHSFVRSFVAIRTKSSKRKLALKNSSVCKYPECSSRE
jgi:hypothetical protein